MMIWSTKCRRQGLNLLSAGMLALAIPLPLQAQTIPPLPPDQADISTPTAEPSTATPAPALLDSPEIQPTIDVTTAPTMFVPITATPTVQDGTLVELPTPAAEATAVATPPKPLEPPATAAVTATPAPGQATPPATAESLLPEPGPGETQSSPTEDSFVATPTPHQIEPLMNSIEATAVYLSPQPPPTVMSTPVTAGDVPLAPPVILPTATPTPTGMPADTTGAPVGTAPGPMSTPPLGERATVSVLHAPSFAVELDGSKQVVDTTMSFLVSDTYNEGRAWSLRLTAIPSKETVARQFPHAVLTIADVKVACVQQPCTEPVLPENHGTVTLTGSSNESIEILKAMPGLGEGEWLVTSTLRLSMPASAHTGDFQLAVGVAIVSGPQ